MSEPTPEPKPEPTPTPEPTPSEPKPDDELGLDERQRRAFEELRRENAKARRDTRAAQQSADELRSELEKRRVESETETERKTREAVAEAVSETKALYERRLLEALVARAAAGKLRDPEDAVRLISFDELLELDDERERERRLSDAIADLIESKPYLAADAAPPAPASSRGLVTQGARSAEPGSRRDGVDADSWLRSRARRR